MRGASHGRAGFYVQYIVQAFLRIGILALALWLGVQQRLFAQQETYTQKTEQEHSAARQYPALKPPKRISTVQEGKSAELSNSRRPAVTPKRKTRKMFMKDQSRAARDAKIGDAESAESKRAKAYDQSRRNAFRAPQTDPSLESQQKLRKGQSKEQKKFAPPVAESAETKKAKTYDKNREMTFSPKYYTNTHPSVTKKKVKERSREAAKFATGTRSREYKKSLAYDHNRRINYSEKLSTVLPASVGKDKARATSDKISQSERGITMDRKAYEDMLKEKNDKLTDAVRGNTMDRAAYRAMLKAKGKKMMASVKGNTMERTSYEKMVERRSKRIAEAVKGNTMLPSAHERLMKNKSEAIADYDAGYLNTKAERQARLRSLLHPKEYQANSPQEQKQRARQKSSEIASFSGSRKRSARRHIENATPSSRPYNNRISLRSMEGRESARRKGARQVARNKKSYLPVFLRKKPTKSKYNDIEKNLWYR